MFEWNTVTKPIPTSPRQVYVDAERTIWQWDNVTQTWTRRPRWYLRQTDQITFYLRTRPITVSANAVTPGHTAQQWDDTLQGAFFEIDFPGGTGTKHYQAQGTIAEVISYVWANTASSGGFFDDQAVVRVFEVFDPDMNQVRVSCHNRMYSSMRGGGSYNRRYRSGLPPTCGIDTAFEGGGGHWTDAFTEPGRDFMNAFHSIVTPVAPLNSSCLIWSHTKKNLYHQPKVGSYVISGSTQRQAYNTGTANYAATGVGDTFQVGTPRFFGLQGLPSPTVRTLETMADLRGGRYFNQHREGLVVYPLTRVAGPDTFYAFYLKPYGIDHFGIGVDQGGSIRVIGEYVGTRGIPSRRKSISSVGWDAWDNVDGPHNIHVSLEVTKGAGLNLDSSEIASRVQMYALDSSTGVRSEPFQRKFNVSRRHANVTICLEPT